MVSESDRYYLNFLLILKPAGHRRVDTDTESEQDVYPERYTPSESYHPGPQSVLSDGTYDYAQASVREPYPAWTSERQIPLSKEYVMAQMR